MRRSFVRRGRSVFLMLPLVLFLGCSATWGRESRVITAEEIQYSGAADAWEAIERAGTPLGAAEARPLAPDSRGFSLRDIPAVIVDGVQMVDLRLLRSIPAAFISQIQILTGTGESSHDSGVGTILIQTRGVQ